MLIFGPPKGGRGLHLWGEVENDKNKDLYPMTKNKSIETYYNHLNNKETKQIKLDKWWNEGPNEPYIFKNRHVCVDLIYLVYRDLLQLSPISTLFIFYFFCNVLANGFIVV